MLTFVAALTLAELIGLSPVEIRQRLAIKEPSVATLSAIDARGGRRTLMFDTRDIIAGGCAGREYAALSVEIPDRPRREAFPRFVFEDERLTTLLPLTGEEPLPADSTLTASCRQLPAADRLDPVTATVGFVLYSPWIALDRIARTPQFARAAAGRAELARLRLGQPPPGGLAAYATKPPAHVTVADESDGAATLSVDIGVGDITKAPDLVRVTVREGRVVAIAKATSNFSWCAMAPDRSMRCGLAKPR